MIEQTMTDMTTRELLKQMVADMKVPCEEREIEIMKRGSFDPSVCFSTVGKHKGAGVWDNLTDKEIETASNAQIADYIIHLSIYCFRQR